MPAWLDTLLDRRGRAELSLEPESLGLKVCKFGGTSLADAGQCRKVKAIIDTDPERRLVVPSAPGKRSAKDQKITDLLYLCHAHAQQGLEFDEVFELIRDRFRRIADELGLDIDLTADLDKVQKEIAGGQSVDYAASRGEYLNGRIVAAILGFDFVDASEVIFFDAKGRIDTARSYAAIKALTRRPRGCVIPGFYGLSVEGRIKTFSRGGSDVSGAVVAAGAGADVYENWTDVGGLLMADPRIVPNPRTIDKLTYRELRELAYMGATVLHDEAIFPVREAGIPVNIRNTNDPDHPGTLILPQSALPEVTGLIEITGIAGRKDFTVILVEKALMNSEVGFGRRLLGVLESNGISYEHTPSGIDTMSVVVHAQQLDGKLEKVIEEIRATCNPDDVLIQPGMALIATVGRGMAHTPGCAARLFGALGDGGINVRMIDQGSSELNIIVGVAAEDFEAAVRAIYGTFVKD
ncbi:MAG: aspartate kinase [Phycisphaeraceae bacterium]|nr:aspartate kinase [Phycisphaeraceae bacterium]